MIALDGSQGEGGGQILRSALALSLVTGTPFRIDNIRAGRPRPGLMRQHLTAVEAAAAVGAAETSGAAVGSRSLSFAPTTVKAGEYTNCSVPPAPVDDDDATAAGRPRTHVALLPGSSPISTRSPSCVPLLGTSLT